MENEYAKLAFLKALITLLDNETKIPKKVFLSSYFHGFEVADKKIQTVIPTPIIRGLMQAENLVFIKKYKEITGPRIITDLAVEFTPVIVGKSKPLVAPKMQKSRQIAEIPAMISNQPNSVILDTVWGGQRESNPYLQFHRLEL